jgi:hypothetical protein
VYYQALADAGEVGTVTVTNYVTEIETVTETLYITPPPPEVGLAFMSGSVPGLILGVIAGVIIGRLVIFKR